MRVAACLNFHHVVAWVVVAILVQTVL